MSTMTATRDGRVLLVDDALRAHDAYARLGWGRRLLLRLVAPDFTGPAARAAKAAHDACVPQAQQFDAHRASSWLGLGRR